MHSNYTGNTLAFLEMVCILKLTLNLLDLDHRLNPLVHRRETKVKVPYSKPLPYLDLDIDNISNEGPGIENLRSSSISTEFLIIDF